MDKHSKPISGYDLAKSIFRECGGRNIDALVDFAGGEKDWLEFKAGLFARPEDLKDGECQEDMLWHVARSIFGFLNSSGGLLVLGIDDRGKPTDLRKGEHGQILVDKGMEAYLREVIEPKMPPRKKNWNTGKTGQWMWAGKDTNRMKDAIEFLPACYRGKDVVLMFVKPLAKGTMELVKQGDRQRLLVRRPGSVAEVENLSDFEEIDLWVHRRRRVETADFALDLQRFKDQRRESIRPKVDSSPSGNGGRPVKQRRPNPAATADRLHCPNCGNYIAVPPRDGKAKCPDCGEFYVCGVREPNFVPQPDRDSDGWAVAKWLLLSFGRWNPRGDSDSRLRTELHVEKESVISWPGVSPGDLQSVLEAHGLDVEKKREKPDSLDGRDAWMRRVLGKGARIAIRYSRSRLDRYYYWIGIERHEGRLRVMDPAYAYGYLTLSQWREFHAEDVRSWNTVFAVSDPE